MRLTSVVVDKISKTCNDQYMKLPKTGKPVDNEWTVLSCVVKYDRNSTNIEVVSLGTGSKCVGATKMSPRGDILNDSHAEVIARRGFLLYLYHEIEKSIGHKQSLFNQEDSKFKLKDGIEFIFYSSQLPCGDASIIPKDGEEDQFGDVLESLKRQADTEICDSEPKVSKIKDIHRTGAKCLPGAKQDQRECGVNYHQVCQVRTKPGRGDRTLSVSCSDKLARWVHVGIQGALLNMFLDKPIYISSFIFGAGVPYSEETLERALVKRNVIDYQLDSNRPDFYQSSVKYPHIRSEERIRPAAGSIVWINSNNVISEVAVHGRKLGVTKKKLNSLSSALSISKFKLFHKFQHVMAKFEHKNVILQDKDAENITYGEMKKMSVEYLKKWYDVRDKFFKIWTVKPDMWNFTIKNDS
ncbi:tRNA-specific adenosine deaminase 1 [Plutella xylostella]|uniref:tRNA-specific adenosine deaminase 1 n=1 Tax=Plutella xylostella TaxID=51655 RepID=UPI0020323AA0|nr:tRNA-specific adenosine deaminase 1 [Plutella xylostella]